MARKSRAERLAQMREVAKRRRKKIQSNEELRNAENQRRRQKYAADEKKRIEKKNKMTNRDKRKCRKYWRTYKKDWRKLQKVHKASAASSFENGTVESYQAVFAKRKRRQQMARCYYKIRSLTDRVTTLQKTVIRYKVRLHRAEKKGKTITNSPRCIVNKELNSSKEKISQNIRKKLLFGAALAADVGAALSKDSPRKLRQKLRTQLTFKFLAKYKFMALAKPLFQVKLYKDRQKRIGSRKAAYRKAVMKVIMFYEQDDVSICAPGKKDSITRNRIRKQKRYLCHSRKYLFQKFCEENDFIISYSSFCHLKPFWVIERHVNERDTCLCKKCENMSLVHSALRKVKLFSDDLPSTMRKLCCDSPGYDCYLRNCIACKKKIITFNVDSADVLPDDPVAYDYWETIEEKDADGKIRKRTIKQRKELTVAGLCDLFYQLEADYMAHVGRIRHQYKALKDLKNSSKEDPSTIIIHCDFSENYSCKYGREIQGCHFGANRKQITIHTGVIYQGVEISSFSSVSRCLHHDAIAIWCHLKPILNQYALDTKKIHFISDSPSSQYRNKGMFKIIFEKIIPMFPKLIEFTWNYLKSGHGKGAADGVGGVLKRTCDRIVANNVDNISNYEQFFSCIEKYVPKVRLVQAVGRDTEDNNVVVEAVAVPGIMKIHQVCWNAQEENILQFNLLSCFKCRGKCKHFFLTEKEYSKMNSYDMPAQEKEPVAQEAVNSIDNSAEFIVQGETEKDEIHESEKDNSNCGAEKSGPDAICHAVDVEDLNVGDWVLIQFDLEDGKTKRRFIGRIKDVVNDKCLFKAELVSEKRTRDNKGLVFTFVATQSKDIPIVQFKITQVIKKLPFPKVVMRGAFLFDSSVHE